MPPHFLGKKNSFPNFWGLRKLLGSVLSLVKKQVSLPFWVLLSSMDLLALARLQLASSITRRVTISVRPLVRVWCTWESTWHMNDRDRFSALLLSMIMVQIWGCWTDTQMPNYRESQNAFQNIIFCQTDRQRQLMDSMNKVHQTWCTPFSGSLHNSFWIQALWKVNCPLFPLPT